jgi:hypothetical protein
MKMGLLALGETSYACSHGRASEDMVINPIEVSGKS